jgi:hypothetical protein
MLFDELIGLIPRKSVFLKSGVLFDVRPTVGLSSTSVNLLNVPRRGR